MAFLVSNNQLDKAGLAVDMEALEQFGVRVSVQTNRAIELVFYFLKNFFSHFLLAKGLGVLTNRK